MSIETRRIIPFGERMPEKYCRLLGHIGQIGVMAEIGRKLDNGGKLPGSSAEAAVIRELCTSIHHGNFSEVIRRVNTMTARNNTHLEVAHRLGMTYKSPHLNRHVMSGSAIQAMKFAAGQTRLAVSSQYEEPFRGLVTFYADRTLEEITLSAAVSRSEAPMAAESIRRSGSDIAYEVKYLEPVSDDGLTRGVEGS